MDKFQEFIKLFQEYNLHTNLMSKGDAEKLAEKHIPDCLSIKKFFEKYAKPQNILDIGTGGGFPAIPIAVSYKDIDVYAMDSIAKKINFIEIVKEKLNIQNIYPICKRIEDFENKEHFDVVTTRAVANLSVLLEYASPFIKKNGYFVAYKSKTADEELINAEKAIKILGLQFVEKINYRLFENEDRCLLVFKKVCKTPILYPRKNNLPRKNPL